MVAIIPTRTLNIGEGTGIVLLQTARTNDSVGIVHDNYGFVADEHVAHGVTLTAEMAEAETLLFYSFADSP